MILDKWHTIIKGSLKPFNINEDLLNDEAIQRMINECDDDQQTIRSMLVEDLVERPNAIDKVQYVKVNQTLITRMLDRLYEYSQMKPLNENLSELYHTIRQHLPSTLDFIEEFFGNYSD